LSDVTKILTEGPPPQVLGWAVGFSFLADFKG
jgi:hypothetical protein